jgi:hypothetical protein
MTQNRPSRRRFPRLPSQCDLSVRPADQHKSIPMVSTVDDVGLGGCRFVSKETFGVNSLLWLTILPKKGIVEARARVVYERPSRGKTFEIGVEFMEISPRDRIALEKLLAPPVPKALPEGTPLPGQSPGPQAQVK